MIRPRKLLKKIRWPKRRRRVSDLGSFHWGDKLQRSDRIRLLQEVRNELDNDPGTPETSADIPGDISDNDLYFKWLRT